MRYDISNPRMVSRFGKALHKCSARSWKVVGERECREDDLSGISTRSPSRRRLPLWFVSVLCAYVSNNVHIRKTHTQVGRYRGTFKAKEHGGVLYNG